MKTKILEELRRLKDGALKQARVFETGISKMGIEGDIYTIVRVRASTIDGFSHGAEWAVDSLQNFINNLEDSKA